MVWQLHDMVRPSPPRQGPQTACCGHVYGASYRWLPISSPPASFGTCPGHSVQGMTTLWARPPSDLEVRAAESGIFFSQAPPGESGNKGEPQNCQPFWLVAASSKWVENLSGTQPCRNSRCPSNVLHVDDFISSDSLHLQILPPACPPLVVRLSSLPVCRQAYMARRGSYSHDLSILGMDPILNSHRWELNQ